MEKTNNTIDFEDAAIGCIIGAFTADSLGSFNEFEKEIQSEEFMETAMKMQGGGPHDIEGG